MILGRNYQSDITYEHLMNDKVTIKLIFKDKIVKKLRQNCDRFTINLAQT